MSCSGSSGRGRRRSRSSRRRSSRAPPREPRSSPRTRLLSARLWVPQPRTFVRAMLRRSRERFLHSTVTARACMPCVRRPTTSRMRRSDPHSSCDGSPSRVRSLFRLRRALLVRPSPDEATRAQCAEDDGAGECERDGEQEVEEAHDEGLVGRNAELREEADEERLSERKAVHRERDEHHEKEQRPEDEVRQGREGDTSRAAREIDREDAEDLNGHGEGEAADEEPRTVTKAVNAGVEAARETLQADRADDGEQGLERYAGTP